MHWETTMGVVAMLASSVVEQANNLICEHPANPANHASNLDWLAFISNIVAAISWPVAILAILYMFRMQMRELLSRIKSGKFGSAEFAFESAVIDLVVEEPIAEEIPPTTAPPSPSAASNPRDAILEAWIRVSSAATELANRHGLIDSSKRTGPSATARALRLAKIIEVQDARSFLKLRDLRNTAAHSSDFDPSPNSVSDYIKIASHLEYVFKTASMKDVRQKPVNLIDQTEQD